MPVNTVKRSLRNKPSQTTGKGIERAQQILDAALELLSRDGYAAVSMRGVATSLGVTLGSVQHYYRTREALLEATLLRLLEQWQGAADRIATESSKVSPGAEFREAMRYFLETNRSPAIESMFAELRALSLRDRFAAHVLERIFLRARKSIGRRIKALEPQIRPKELDERSLLVLDQLMGALFVSAGRDRDDAILDVMLATAHGR